MAQVTSAIPARRPALGGARPGPGTVRRELSTAAINLFLANGYERTTAEDIAEAAGVARRTFFRHFRTKEDAIFPDHEACLKRVEGALFGADPTRPPLEVVSEAAHLVLDMYAEDTETSVRRYQVIREVELLREREIVATSRYQRASAEFLDRRLGGRDGAVLLHEMVAAAVVAAHNFVLRQWLREGGTGDVHAQFDAAMNVLSGQFPDWLLMQSGANPPEHLDEVMVLMLRPDTPQWRIAQEIKDAIAESDAGRRQSLP